MRALLERGDDVRVLDNFATGRRANLADIDGDVEIVEGDLRSYERVHTAVRGVEVVFHQGALGSVPRSVQDPLTTTAVNVEGTLNVLLAARDEGVRRVVAASSSSVYGDGGTFPAPRPAAPNPISPTRREAGRGEVLRQLLPRLRARDGRAPLLQRLRPAPGPELAVRRRDPALRRAPCRTAPGDDLRDGEQSRDFTYVANVVEANIVAGTAEGAVGSVLNIAAGVPVTVNEVADSIGRLLDRPVEREFAPSRAGDVDRSWADVSRARDLIGFETRIGFEEGLRLTIDSLNEEG